MQHEQQELEHLDHEALAELKDVMEDDFPILLSTYLNDSQMRIQALRTALEEQDPQHYAKTAHSLKGSCVNIGAMRLGQICARAERDSREGSLEHATSHLDAISAEFAVVTEQLSEYLNS